MLRTSVVVAGLAILGAACSKDSNATDGKDQPGASAKKAPVDLPQDAESRLARLEKRLDKVIEVLEPRLGSPEPDPSKIYSVPLDPRDPVEGPADARVTVVEGFEFACPYCLQAAPIIDQLAAAFPKDVRVVTKYMVVHEQAVPAGLASCAANKQGRYPEYKRTIWAKAWGPDGRPIMEQLSPNAMESFAAELGLDLEKFRADMSSEDCRDWLINSEKTLRAVGQSGTPGFYVNGRPLGGLVPFDSMKKIVEEEIAKADKAISGGIAQADFYQKVVVEGGEKELPGWFDVD